MSEREGLVNERAAAKRLGMSVATLRRWRCAGHGPPFAKIGAAVRYDPAALAIYIVERSRRSTTDDGGGAR